MKKLLLCAALAASFCINTAAQAQEPSPAYKIVSGGDWVMAKNYYLLTLIKQDKEAAKLLMADGALATLSKNRADAVRRSLAECKDALCFPVALRLSDEDIKLVSDRLTALYKPGNALGKLVSAHLLPSGTYGLYKATGAELLVKAWEQDAAAVNHTIAVYAEGKKANYPAIDSISFNVKNRGYGILMYDCTTEVIDNLTTNSLFFEPALNAALTYLEVNERRNAADYEPMATTVNKPAADRVKTIKWAAYPYTHILVPGAGPDVPGTPLSGEGMLRCRTAARKFLLGKAPFIVVSGGNVHPYKTKYNEAVEMKKYMIERLHIPANAIIIEPHARHTTTNLRNDARLAFRYGMPFSKPGLIVTDKYQNDFITTMDKRCMNELKYVPYTLGKRLSDTELEFYPLAISMQIDADEPMDP
ncbi:YdcF family protein [Mucilaginibacter pedocola]|uniref:DUF218 domain-containing protein n=1 Tax=Mucilaginibacter pedocola TaxID=1792845 RepID=A0A1S9P8P5_9SPHI|nr:YdcF family protein [Mucilaginibacter pedocola]OOQ57331.1 hypothetical protein BC343_14580 [Mucilaginibacter pedocola]